MVIKPKNNRVPTFLKWAGGKTQLLHIFEGFVPKDFNRYLEPFLGSGAVFFFVKQKYGNKEFILSDKNEELINCFKVVRDNVEELVALLEEYKKKHSQEYYYKVRDIDTKTLSTTESAARFVYLNKTCFNGLYRVNTQGKFNVPIGKYKNPGILNERNLRRASKLLQGVTLKTMSFEGITDIASAGDFVYLDPPYYSTSQTSNFTGYTKDSFSDEDQEKVRDVFKQLDEKGCLVMLSNSNHEFIRSLYDGNGYNINIVDARRMINCNAEKRGAVEEIVVLNY